MNFKTIFSYLWKLPLCGAAFIIGMIISGIVLPIFGFSAPEMPAGTDETTIVAWFFLGSMLIALSLSFLSRSLSANLLGRWIILAEMAWIIGAVSMVLESWFFMDTGAVSSTMNALYTLLNFAIPFLLMTAAIALLFPPTSSSGGMFSDLKAFFLARPKLSWVQRVIIALAAYPIIYIVFGLMVEPFIRDFYTQGFYELTIPTWGQIIPLQLARSMMFLIACLPSMIWLNGVKEQRLLKMKLWLALGLALFTLTAFMAVITAYWFPWQLRLFHGIELLASAYVYAGALIWLFSPQKETQQQARVIVNNANVISNL